MKVNRQRYTLLLYLAAPIVVVMLVWKLCRHPALRTRWLEWTGRFPHVPAQPPLRPVIFHAVSLGEVHAASPLIEAFMTAHPDIPVLVTCSSLTGSQRIQALFGERVRHVFLPYDFPGAVGRFLDHFDPRLIVILETELWPNLIHHARRRNVRVIVANARLSERSQRRYAGLGSLVPDMLSEIDCVAAQSAADAERFRSIGRPAAVIVTGNLKYDLDLNVDRKAARDLRQSLFGERPVLIAASTREGEDAKVLAAFSRIRQSRPELALVLVPRHPERFQTAARLFEAAGCRVALRSKLDTHKPSTVDVLVGDSMGELLRYYSLADIAFVGGSLVDTGCQNIIEPAALGLPVITGPSRYNFQQVSDELLRNGAQFVVEDAAALAACVCRLLDDDAARIKMAQAAQRTVHHGKGATERTLGIIQQALGYSLQTLRTTGIPASP